MPGRSSTLAVRPKSSFGGNLSSSSLPSLRQSSFSPTHKPASGSIDGQIRVVVDLSSDLEGRIVDKSLDGVADVLAQVNRSKYS